MLVTTPDPQAPLTFDIRAAHPSDVYPVLALHREAFADKFGAAFGMRRMAQGIEAMAEAWRRQGPNALRGMFVACAGDKVIGTITLRTWEMGGDDTAAAELAFQQVLGMWGAFRSIFALSLLDHTISRDEGYITDVAVLSGYRRRGVAQALLARVESEARQRRKRYLGLYVSAANRGARALYEHSGFYTQRMRRSLLTSLVLHQFAWVYMRKELTP